MTGAALRFAAVLLTATALAACQPGEGPFAAKPKTDGADAAAPAKSKTSTRLVDRDVEAPDVFQVTDSALWDGRPSLGGVWVASPDATDPERVIMRNPANGAFVIGALFKRERDNPGPTLQISSDAAEALGLLAGQPGQISVTALRREEAPETAPETPLLDTAEAVGDPAKPPVEGAIVQGGVETVALDAPPAPKPGKKPVAETAAIAAAALETVPAPKPPAPAPAAAAAAAGGRAIQIGFFSVEANAKRAVDTLAKAGIPAEMRADSAKGKSYWSVLARGDAALLKKVKAAGFADAYLLN